MKFKKALAIGLTAMMAVSMAACGGSVSSTSGSDAGTDSAAADCTASDSSSSDSGDITYASVKLGETGTDLSVDLKLLTNRTDMLKDDYNGTTWAQYLEAFNKDYPNIKVDIEGLTNYADDSLLRLQGGDWGDIMMIPAVAKTDLSTYFLSYGSTDEVAKEVNYTNNWQYQGQTYGVPITANACGIVYNKKIFEQAGITELPTTPDEFIADLQKIKDNTDAIPLYTNYAAGWTLGAWDDYITGSATGDADWQNNGLVHGKNPFADPGDGTHAYNVYKILYEAVNKGLTEDDYSTTDWESSKGMMNSGEVATMVLGSWAVSQMQAAGDNPDDVAYMPFPITVNGEQYASAGPDYNFGISATTDADHQLASMIFVKWMTEKSGFSYNEGGLPIAAGDTKMPALYDAFSKVTFVTNTPAPEGEEDYMNELNADSELNISNGGNDKVAAIVEAASDGSQTFDDIMNDWNEKWSAAQESVGIAVN